MRDMKTYSDQHWVTDQLITDESTISLMNRVGSDLKEAQNVLTEMTARYGTSGTKTEYRTEVMGVMDEVFDDGQLSDDDDDRYSKDQVRSAYIIALAAENLRYFMMGTVAEMLNHMDEYGSDDS
jgi:hypothetical protein